MNLPKGVGPSSLPALYKEMWLIRYFDEKEKTGIRHGFETV